jgi:hypothetical protein
MSEGTVPPQATAACNRRNGAKRANGAKGTEPKGVVLQKAMQVVKMYLTNVFDKYAYF